MRTIWTIAKKEFARFLKDKRMLIALFLPGLLIYCIYSFLGDTMGSLMGVEENPTYHVCVVNTPEWLTEEALSPLGDFVLESAETAHENVEDLLKDGTFDAYMVFPKGFDVTAEGVEKQEVQLYMNTADTTSQMAGQALSALISSLQYGEPKFTLTAVDVATEEDVSAMIFTMIGPMLVLVMMTTGCVAVAPESIAGEKERGTLATMLVTKVKRSHIAVGKVLALAVISVLSGISSFMGVVLSLPKLFGDTGVSISMSTYGFIEYLSLFGIILSTVLLMVSLVSILSTFSKSVKEAATMASSVMILNLVVGLACSLVSAEAWYFYLIPILNSALVLSGVFSMSINPLFMGLTILTNVVVTAALAWVLTKMFNSEKIIFSK